MSCVIKVHNHVDQIRHQNQQASRQLPLLHSLQETKSDFLVPNQVVNASFSSHLLCALPSLD